MNVRFSLIRHEYYFLLVILVVLNTVIPAIAQNPQGTADSVGAGAVCSPDQQLSAAILSGNVAQAQQLIIQDVIPLPLNALPLAVRSESQPMMNFMRQQTLGIRQYQQGRYTFFSMFNDGFMMPSSMFVCPDDQGQGQPAFTTGNKLLNCINVFMAVTPGAAVKSNREYILIDAGLTRNIDWLLRQLRQLNVSPGCIQNILLTHIHPDHIGGLVDGNGRAVFPNAVVHVAKAEWEFWQTETGENQLNRRFFAAYADKVRLFEWDTEVLPNVTALNAAGHTPGHTVYRFDCCEIGQGGSACWFIGDLVHASSVQFQRPEVCARFDKDISAAVKARKAFIDKAVSDRRLIWGAHIESPGVGMLQKDEHQNIGIKINYGN